METRAARIILVAIDASPHSLAALEAAARVASQLHAELHGMYVEDINLIRMAELPFARAIDTAGKARPLTRDTLEPQLRRQADAARHALESAGARSHVSVSFAVARGMVVEEIERAAVSAEILIVGRKGWSARTGGRIGSIARTLLEHGPSSLMMVEKNGLKGPIAIVFDGSDASMRALSLANSLAGNQASSLTLLLASRSPQLLEAAFHALKESGIDARIEVPQGPHEDLVQTLHQFPARTVLVPMSLFSEASQAANVVESLDRCVLLVR